MKKESVYRYFFFGVSYWYMKQAREGHPIHRKEGERKLSVLDALDGFLISLDDFELPVTHEVLRNQGVYDLRVELRQSEKDSKLSAEQASRLSDLMGIVEVTLGAEMDTRSAYVITPKRLDIKKLDSDVGNLFAPNVYGSLPAVARYDFTEASKCILFERPTAAAFHLLRGTEDVLRQFYLHLAKHKRIKQKEWGPLVGDLRNRAKCKPHIPLLDRLDHIRHNYRNPTQHPERKYDINEVQDLWSLCVEVVNQMIGIMNKAQA